MKMVNGFVVMGCCFGLGACSVQPKACCDENQRWSSGLEESIGSYQDRMECVTPVYLVSPFQCFSPGPSGPRMSEAGGGGHAKKLYHLYVSDGEGYRKAVNDEIENPVGLTLVKEAHVAIVANEKFQIGQQYDMRLTHEARLRGEMMYTPGDVSSLFIMSKVGGVDMPGTDRGWVYGGATPDGEVYASGLIESCMNCHAKAPHDRLFGLREATTVYMSIFQNEMQGEESSGNLMDGS